MASLVLACPPVVVVNLSSIVSKGLLFPQRFSSAHTGQDLGPITA